MSLIVDVAHCSAVPSSKKKGKKNAAVLLAYTDHFLCKISRVSTKSLSQVLQPYALIEFFLRLNSRQFSRSSGPPSHLPCIFDSCCWQPHVVRTMFAFVSCSARLMAAPPATSLAFGCIIENSEHSIVARVLQGYSSRLQVRILLAQCCRASSAASTFCAESHCSSLGRLCGCSRHSPVEPPPVALTFIRVRRQQLPLEWLRNRISAALLRAATSLLFAIT